MDSDILHISYAYQLLLGHLEARWDILSLQLALGLPQGLLLVEQATPEVDLQGTLLINTQTTSTGPFQCKGAVSLLQISRLLTLCERLSPATCVCSDRLLVTTHTAWVGTWIDR